MDENIVSFIIFVTFYNIFSFLLLIMNKFSDIFIIVLLDFTTVLM